MSNRHDALDQARHKKKLYYKGCDALGKLIDVKIVKAPVFNNPIAIKFIWQCQKCHDQFETEMPYLEVYKL